MKDDIKHLLDGALEAPPPMSIDSENAMARGRVALGRRRRLVGGGIAAVVLSAALSVTLAMNTIGGDGGIPSGRPSGSASPSASASHRTSTTGGLPSLDPTADYLWENVGPDVRSVIAEGYTSALRSHLSKEYGAQLSGPSEFLENHLQLERRTSKGAGGDDLDQNVSAGFVTGAYYTLQQEGWWNTNRVRFPGEDEVVDNFTVEIWPAGSFVKGGDGYWGDRLNNPQPGTSGFYDLIGCRDQVVQAQANQTFVVRTECEDPSPDVITGVSTISGVPNHEERTVVLYRSDGSAVVVKNTGVRPADGDAEAPPTRDFEQLVALARALPML